MRKGVIGKSSLSRKGGKSKTNQQPKTTFTFEGAGDQFFVDSTEKPLLEVSCDAVSDASRSAFQALEVSLITFNEKGKKQDALSLAKRASWNSPVLVTRTNGGQATMFSIRLNELLDKKIEAFTLMATVNHRSASVVSGLGGSFLASSDGLPEITTTTTVNRDLSGNTTPFRFKLAAPSQQQYYLSAASGGLGGLGGGTSGGPSTLNNNISSARMSSRGSSGSNIGAMTPFGMQGTATNGGSRTARRPSKEPVSLELADGLSELPNLNNSSITFLTGRHIPDTDRWSIMLVVEHVAGKSLRQRSSEVETLARKVVLGWCPSTTHRSGGATLDDSNTDAYEDALGGFPEGFFDDCDTESSSSGDERYHYPRPKEVGRPKRPRVVRQTKKHYSTGRAVGAKPPRNTLGCWALQDGQRDDGTDASTSEDELIEDQSDLAVKLPMFESRMMIRYDNSCYNQGSKRTRLVSHLVAKADEYNSGGNEAGGGGTTTSHSGVRSGSDQHLEPMPLDPGEADDDDSPPATPNPETATAVGGDTPSKRLSMTEVTSPSGSNIAATLDGYSDVGGGSVDPPKCSRLPPLLGGPNNSSSTSKTRKRSIMFNSEGSDAEGSSSINEGLPSRRRPQETPQHQASSAVATPQAPSSPPPPVSATRRKKKELQRDPLGFLGKGELQTWLNKLVGGGVGLGGGLPTVPRRATGAKPRGGGTGGPVPGRRIHSKK